MGRLIAILAGAVMVMNSYGDKEENNFYSQIIFLDNVATKVHQNYVRNVPVSELIDHSISGMFSVLDNSCRLLYDTTDEVNHRSDSINARSEIGPAFVTGAISATIGYLRVTKFEKYSLDKTEEYLRTLVKSGCTGLIVDLRYSEGGPLPACLDFAKLFLSHRALIGSSKARVQDQNKEFKAANKALFPDSLPLVVLVNRRTASGAELIASALQDNKRAILIGDTTAGIGKVTSLLRLDNMHVLQITTAALYSANGKCLDRQTGSSPFTAIVPNILEATETSSPALDALMREGIVQDFLADSIAAAGDDSQILKAFPKYLESRLSAIQLAQNTFVFAPLLTRIARDDSVKQQYIRTRIAQMTGEFLVNELRGSEEQFVQLIHFLRIAGKSGSVKPDALTTASLDNSIKTSLAFMDKTTFRERIGKSR